MNADNAALLDEFCDSVWLEDGLAKNTLESYRRDLRLFADWHERQGRASLLGATEADLAEYFAWLYLRRSPGKKHGIRSSTQARLHSSLKRFYRFLARGRRIEIDPTLKLDPPRRSRRAFPRRSRRSMSKRCSRSRIREHRSGSATVRCWKCSTRAGCASRSWSV